MKASTLLALFVCLVSCVTSLPLPTSGDEGPSRKLDKGKGKALPDDTPPSRPETPEPADDDLVSSHVPLPGRNGVHQDPNTKVFTAYYGDDKMPEHMGHVERNQALHPGNREPMLRAEAVHPLLKDSNRDQALNGIQAGGIYRNTATWPRVRDEKHIAMLYNPNHKSTTTVEYLPDHESRMEGGLTSTLSRQMEHHGPDAQGQIRANPGWLRQDPHQRIAHEAPARLNSQTFRTGMDPAAPGSSKTTKAKTSAEKEAEAKKNEEDAKRRAAGYVPVVEGGKQLRERKGQAVPPPSLSTLTGGKEKKKTGSTSTNGETNLVQGRVSEPGYPLWHPNTDPVQVHPNTDPVNPNTVTVNQNTYTVSHKGAPPPVTNSHTRQPLRPQNYEQHMQQQAAAEHAQQHPSNPAPIHGPNHPPNTHPNLPVHPQAGTNRFQANLATFNAQFGHGGQTHGGEAPGRLQSQTAPHAHPAPAPQHNHPASSHASGSQPHPARPQTPPAHSAPKPAPAKGKKP